MLITSAPTCYSSTRLIAEFKALYHTTPEILNPLQLNCQHWINRHSLQPILIRSTGMNYDDSDLYLAQTFHAPLIQNINEQLLFRDKLRQYLWFKEQNLPAIPTEYNYDSTSKFHHGPFIVKSRRGMQGRGVTYIENTKSLLSLLSTLKAINDQQFLVQPFIAGTEYRIFVLRHKIYAVLKKEKATAITANAHSGVATSLISNYTSKSITSILTTLKSHYYAIDLILNQEREYLLEINLAPGFQQLEQLTNANIAREIWKI